MLLSLIADGIEDHTEILPKKPLDQLVSLASLQDTKVQYIKINCVSAHLH